MRIELMLAGAEFEYECQYGCGAHDFLRETG